MTIRCRTLTLFLMFVFVPWSVAADAGIVISGIVRNGDGSTVEGANLTITVTGASAPAFRTITDKSGQYEFDNILPGEYRIAVEMRGMISAEVIRVSSSSGLMKIDLTFGQPVPTSIGSSSQAPPKFEAAGVRGLIDPGGYSAPAGAAASSSLIEGMADIKRPSNRLGALDAKTWPCGMESNLRKEVEAHPDKANANRRMGEFYLAHDDASRSISFLERARQADPSDYEASLDLAAAWIGTEQFDSAHNVLTELIAKRQDHAAYELLARSDEGSGKFLQASHDYELAANIEPSEENVFGIGYELILAGSPNDAANALRSATDKHPKSVRLRLGLGTAEFLTNRTSEALDSFLLASDLDPVDPRPYEFLAGILKIYGGETDRVCATFKRFMNLVPGNAEAPYFYAQCILQNWPDGDHSIDTSNVESLLKQSIALDPKLAKVHFQLAILYSNEGNYEDAAREYETTLRLNPEMKECHYRLAIAYRHLGRDQDAARESKLFQEVHQQEAVVGAINIEKLISVMGSAHGTANPAYTCLSTQ